MMIKSIARKIRKLLSRRKYLSKEQKAIFRTNLNEKLEEKVQELKKDNDKKDNYINKLLREIVHIKGQKN